jgi:hypothetical protein
MQGYFAQINAYLVTMTRIPLPENKQLSDDEFKELASILLLQIGITLDHEVNGLLAHLETLIVESVYKLHLTRPRRSLTRNGMLNMDMIKIAKTLDRKTLWGTNKEKYFALLLSQICAYKDVDLSESDFENMIKSAFAEV